MIVTLAFCTKDADLAIQLLEWIEALGGCKEYDCVLVMDCAVDWGKGLEAVTVANRAFRSAVMATNEMAVEGWIPGSNSLFKTAALEAQKRGEPFLFIEPDAVPTKKTWLIEIDEGYQKCGKPFMGAIVAHSSPGLANPYLEGCAVYPADTWNMIESHFNEQVAWTLACQPVTLPNAANSPLFQHFWGPSNELAPTFSLMKTQNSPINTLLLGHIRPDTALFHRCKDGSLMRLLKKNYFRGCPQPSGPRVSSSLVDSVI